MEHLLPNLPFSMNDLAPHISKEALEYHYGKHHRSYVVKLNAALPGTAFENSSLEEIIKLSEGSLFNNAAQVWNHTFYWNCLHSKGGGAPQNDLLTAIQKEWGSFEQFKEKFTSAAISNFGSGWTWLVQKQDKTLKILSTSNAQSPLKSGVTILMVIDIWEHAYYIDYRNERPKYIQAFWNLLNWDFVSSNFAL